MEYQIIGSTMPMVEIKLNAQEKVYAQTGALQWMSGKIDMGTGARGGVFGAVKRKVSGEDVFVNDFTAEKDGEYVAFGHTFPGHIIPIDVSNRSVLCQKRAFLCAEDSVEWDIAFQKKLGTAFFGGEGFILQKLSGEGTAFVEIDGECVVKELAEGEILKVETGAVGMFEESIEMNIERVKGFRNMFFGGEGMFITTLKGPGKVWLQTMPIQSMGAELSGYLDTSSS